MALIPSLEKNEVAEIAKKVYQMENSSYCFSNSEMSFLR